MWDLIGGVVKSQELSAERFSGQGVDLPATQLRVSTSAPNQPAVTCLVV